MGVDERIEDLVRHQEIEELRSCMEACGMQDLTSTGCFFTRKLEQQAIWGY